VIPLPRASLLAGAMLVGTTVGMVAAIVSAVFVKVHIRPDVAIALVIGVPCVVGLVLVLLSVKKWMTTVGAFVLAIGPGWLGELVAIRAVHGV
jgi:putative holin